MTKLFFTLTFYFIIFNQYCLAQVNLEIFNKKWKLEVDIKKRLKELPPDELAAYNQMTESQKKKIEDDLINQAEKSIFQFFSDNTFKVDMAEVEHYEGTWRISEDGKSVILRTNQGAEEKVIIKKITSAQIIIASEKKGKELILVPK